MRDAGITELLFESNGDTGMHNVHINEDVLITLNFNKLDSEETIIKSLSSKPGYKDQDAPLFCTELWTGWFHSWGTNDGLSNVISDKG